MQLLYFAGPAIHSLILFSIGSKLKMYCFVTRLKLVTNFNLLRRGGRGEEIEEEEEEEGEEEEERGLRRRRRKGRRRRGD